MIWVGLAILVAVIVFGFVIDWHLAQIKGGLNGIGQLLGALERGLLDSNNLLREINRDIAKVSSRSLGDDEGPGGPID